METGSSHTKDRQTHPPSDVHAPASTPVYAVPAPPQAPELTLTAMDRDVRRESSQPTGSTDPTAPDAAEGAAEAAEPLRQVTPGAQPANRLPVPEDDGLLKGLAKELGVLPPKGT